MQFLKVLRTPHLLLLWLGQVLSAVGDHLFQVALVWTAIRLIGSATGFITAVGAITTLAFGLLGGALADRWNRRTTMIAVDGARAVLVGLLPLLAVLSLLNLWTLLAALVLIESLGSLFDPALQASLPALAGDAQTLQMTNGLMDATRRLARILGPGLVGLLILFMPIYHFFSLDALSFAISALTLLALGSRFAWHPSAPQRSGRGLNSVLADIREALRLVRAHRPLVWALPILGIANLIWSAIFTIGVPLLTLRVLHANVGAYGLIIGAYGVGNIVGSLVIGSLVIRRRMTVMFAGKVVLGLGLLLLAASPTLGLALLGSAVAALGGPMGDLMLLAIVQLDFPAEHTGKVFSFYLTIESIGSTFGLLLAVPVFAYLNASIGIALFSLLVVIAGASGLLRFRGM